MTDLDRKFAWRNIKSAIRSYAKDPTARHAQEVEEAWREIRRMETLSHWRELPAKSFGPGKSSGQPGHTR